MSAGRAEGALDAARREDALVDLALGIFGLLAAWPDTAPVTSAIHDADDDDPCLDFLVGCAGLRASLLALLPRPLVGGSEPDVIRGGTRAALR